MEAHSKKKPEAHRTFRLRPGFGVWGFYDEAFVKSSLEAFKFEYSFLQPALSRYNLRYLEKYCASPLAARLGCPIVVINYKPRRRRNPILNLNDLPLTTSTVGPMVQHFAELPRSLYTAESHAKARFASNTILLSPQAP